MRTVDSEPRGNVLEASGIIDDIEAGKSIFIAPGKTIDGSLPLRRVRFVFGDIIIKDAIINGIVDAEGVTFAGNINLDGCTFRDGVNFGRATFRKQVSLDRAKFGHRLSFAGTNFCDKVSLKRATFSESIDFAGVYMKFPADFAAVHIREANIFRWLFNYPIYILWWLLYRLLSYPVMYLWLIIFLIFYAWKPANKEDRENIDEYKNETFRNILNKIKPRRFMPTDFSIFNTNEVIDISSNLHFKNHVDEYQWLKAWRESARWRTPLFWIWGATSYYGRSFTLWAFWSSVIVIFFTYIYHGLGCGQTALDVDKLGYVQPGFMSYLYQSIVTFTTLGGGIVLTNATRIWVAAEVVIGYVMLGGLVGIFVNKFTRRG